MVDRAGAARAYRPRPPFLGWPQHWAFDGGYAWLTPSGPAIVTQTTVSTVTAANVHSLQDVLDELAAARAPERLPGLCLVHDWRSVTSIEPAARKAWTRRTDRPGKPYAAVRFYVSLGPSPILRMALKSAALAVQLAIGQRLAHFVDDPEDALRSVGVAAPGADFLGPWLAGGGVALRAPGAG